MARYAALLRGVNVGGKNKVPMADLRALAESLGLADVTSFIQSGNLLFTSRSRPDPADLEAAVTERFAINVSVVVRSASELRSVLSNQPFPQADLSNVHVGFLTGKPPASSVKRLDPGRFEPEIFTVRGVEVYMHLPAGMARTKVPAYIDTNLRIPMTIRNWNTVTKLAELAG